MVTSTSVNLSVFLLSRIILLIKNIKKSLYLFVSLLLIAGPLITANPALAKTQFNGVNLAGADFGYDVLPGVFGTQYTYPTQEEVDYFVGKGMNIFRLPFLWERLQNDQNGPLNQDELSRIKDFVSYATSKQAKVILDPHNGARYYGEIIGIDGDLGALPVAAFEDFWTKLALEFKDNANVIFGLMNEPNNMPSELWRDDANAGIRAIRATGATNLILVPGNAWTGAHSWNDNGYGTPNGIVMQSIVDSGNNYAFEVHQYLDSDSSGTSENCVSTTIGAERLEDFTAWLRQHNQRGFLGEFAGGRNATCLSGLDIMLDYMDANDDVWLGWTYWAAGPWWGEDMYTLEPKDGVDRPQMAELLKHISSGEVTTSPPTEEPSDPPVVNPPSNTLTPLDDVNNSADTAGTLAVSKWEHAFLRFDVSNLRNLTLNNAHLRVYHQGQLAPLTLSVNEAGHDNWTEASANPPELVYVHDDPGLILDSVTINQAGYVEFDITDFVLNEANNDGVATVELSSNHDNWSFISSKEGDNTPQLVWEITDSTDDPDNPDNNADNTDRNPDSTSGSGGGSFSNLLLSLLFLLLVFKYFDLHTLLKKNSKVSVFGFLVITLGMGGLLGVAQAAEYTVSKNGSDANPGTSESPFVTISHCAEIAMAGDTCWVRSGIYRETVIPAHSGTNTAPIHFKAHPGDQVLISGADVVTGFSDAGNGRYQADMAWDLGVGQNQVFVDGKKEKKGSVPMPVS